MELCLIWARNDEGAIGIEGRLPWHLPEDLAHFKRHTLGCPVIMGRKTWESLPRKPLPGRHNIIVTRQGSALLEGQSLSDCVCATNLERALELAQSAKAPRVFIIGGAQLYAQALPIAHRVFETVVQAPAEHADAFAPCLDATWQCMERSQPMQSTTGLSYTFCEYARGRELSK